MRAVLREIKWPLNLQPWNPHLQCVRRCIFVDHHWIIFHLITSQLLRADERGIKSNLTPHKRFPYDQTNLSTSSMFPNPIVKFYRWELPDDGKINDRGGDKKWSTRGRCVKKSDEIVRRNVLWVKAACGPPPLPGGNRGVICGHWWFLRPPQNPRK